MDFTCLQIRSGIDQEIRMEEIKEGNVIAWDVLITKLRRHVKLTGECIKTQLMLHTCETVFVVSFGTYLVIKSAGGYNSETNMGYAIIAGFYCVVKAVRLCIRVAVAEGIYAEESKLKKISKQV